MVETPVKYFIAQRFETTLKDREIISITKNPEAIAPAGYVSEEQAFSIVQEMLNLQSELLTQFPSTNIVLIIDISPIMSAIIKAMGTPKFYELEEMVKKFDKIIVYPSTSNVQTNIVKGLILIRSQRTSNKVVSADNLQTAFRIAQQ
jgi:hypothetical protein